MPVELWKSIFDWSTVILAALTFVALAGALITGNMLSDRQEEQLRKFEKDVVDANARAAEANQKAEEERLARVKIEEKLGGWKLDHAGIDGLFDNVKAFPNTKFDLSVNPVEARFMEVLNATLERAGWKRQEPTSDAPPRPDAVSIPLFSSVIKPG